MHQIQVMQYRVCNVQIYLLPTIICFGVQSCLSCQNKLNKKFFHRHRYKTRMFRNSNSTLPFTNDFNTTEHADYYFDQNCPGSDSKVVEVVFKALAYFIILIVSLVGNLLILLITYKNRQLRKSISFLCLQYSRLRPV